MVLRLMITNPVFPPFFFLYFLFCCVSLSVDRGRHRPLLPPCSGGFDKMSEAGRVRLFCLQRCAVAIVLCVLFIFLLYGEFFICM